MWPTSLQAAKQFSPHNCGPITADVQPGLNGKDIYLKAVDRELQVSKNMYAKISVSIIYLIHFYYYFY